MGIGSRKGYWKKKQSSREENESIGLSSRIMTWDKLISEKLQTGARQGHASKRELFKEEAELSGKDSESRTRLWIPQGGF